MKLVRWVLALHLVAIGISCGIAMACEADATKLRAASLSACIVGSITVSAALIYLLRTLAKGRSGAREPIMLVILLYIGFVEVRRGMAGWEYLAALPG